MKDGSSHLHVKLHLLMRGGGGNDTIESSNFLTVGIAHEMFPRLNANLARRRTVGSPTALDSGVIWRH
jgi:hypothetical protein